MRSGVFAGTLLVFALVITGCGANSSPSAGSRSNGEETKPARQVLVDALKAAHAAKSFHFAGELLIGGGSLGFQMTAVPGKGETGWITFFGGKANLVIVGSTVYLKADAHFWRRVDAKVAAAAAGKWVKFPASDPQFRALTDTVNPSGLLHQLSVVPAGLQSKGVTTYRGQSVVELDGGAQYGTLYVADSGQPYPVGGQAALGNVSITATFSSWNESATVSAPSGAIDISKLGG